MSKGTWKKRSVCDCGICKACKDRARLDKIKASKWAFPRRKTPENVAAKAAAKAAKEQAKEEKQAAKERHKRLQE